ncbi:FtsK/SpoIIIE domain-containing protein [Desulfovibrio gilichinskyi]|uniref:FtsK/SpoIIIE family protein n=1 Tax=Desulfovibrio gilichinskyi TaxID=1519643 RepID=A0A1X7C1I3_9BACT|nr:FtsK/SpoIIIE domain-containing protein [Desulfovibrio gilichinskyi]SME87839.1 FtsK/SpoIIIE family protein [Desulfovibrio gilichinskyi]
MNCHPSTDCSRLSSILSNGHIGFFCSRERTPAYTRFAQQLVVQFISDNFVEYSKLEIVVADYYDRGRHFAEILPAISKIITDESLLQDKVQELVNVCDRRFREDDVQKEKTFSFTLKNTFLFLSGDCCSILGTTEFSHLLRYGREVGIFIVMVFSDVQLFHVYNQYGDVFYQQDSVHWDTLWSAKRDFKRFGEKPVALGQIDLDSDKEILKFFTDKILEEREKYKASNTLTNLLKDAERHKSAVTGIKVPIGRDEDGETCYFELDKHPKIHTMVSGTTGAGKSNFFKTLVSSCIHSYSPDELQLVLIDLKQGAAFNPFKLEENIWMYCDTNPESVLFNDENIVINEECNIPPVGADEKDTPTNDKIISGEDLSSILDKVLTSFEKNYKEGMTETVGEDISSHEILSVLDIFSNLHIEFEERIRLFTKYSFDNYQDFREGYIVNEVGRNLPRILIIIDEVQILFDKDNTRDSLLKCAGLLRRLFAEGRAAGFHFILSTQSFDISRGFTLPEAVEQNSGVRISFSATEDEDSSAVLGRYNYSAVGLDIGECIHNLGKRIETNKKMTVAYFDK